MEFISTHLRWRAGLGWVGRLSSFLQSQGQQRAAHREGDPGPLRCRVTRATLETQADTMNRRQRAYSLSHHLVVARRLT